MRGRASRATEHGIALVLVLLMTFMAGAAATVIVETLSLGVRHSQRVFARERAMLVAVSVERLAAAHLQELLASQATLGDQHGWQALAGTVLPTELKGDTHIEDLQSRLNLNTLVRNAEIDAVQLERLARLLELAGQPAALTEPLALWLGERLSVEDQPARFRALGELATVPGWSSSLVDSLAEHLTVQPEPTDINVNSASSVILQSLSDDMTPGDAHRIIEARGTVGFASLDEFLRQPGIGAVAPGGLTVRSRYYRVNTRIGGLSLRSVLRRRANGTMEVISRALGPFDATTHSADGV